MLACEKDFISGDFTPFQKAVEVANSSADTANNAMKETSVKDVTENLTNSLAGAAKDSGEVDNNSVDVDSAEAFTGNFRYTI